jgi:hypothetical protein
MLVSNLSFCTWRYKKTLSPWTHSLWEFGSAADAILKMSWVGGFNLG